MHDDQRIEAKLAVCFIAAILRTEIELACRRLELDPNKSLREADRTVLTLMPNDEYCAVHAYSKRMAPLYAEFGLSDEHLDFFAQEVNGRRNPVHSQTRTMPPFEAPAPKRKPGRPVKNQAPEEAGMPKRKAGRPKGSKNKKTLEREALLTAPPKRGLEFADRQSLPNAPQPAEHLSELRDQRGCRAQTQRVLQLADARPHSRDEAGGKDDPQSLGRDPELLDVPLHQCAAGRAQQHHSEHQAPSTRI